MKKTFLIINLLIICVLFAGCSIDFDYFDKLDEKYEKEASLAASEEVVSSADSNDEMTESADINNSTADVDFTEEDEIDDLSSIEKEENQNDDDLIYDDEEFNSQNEDYNTIVATENQQDKEKKVMKKFDINTSISGITASSQLADEVFNDGVYNYSPWNLVDGDYSVSWCEGVNGTGENEYVKFEFDDTYSINGIIIYNGLCTDSELFYKNSRVSLCRIIFSDGSSYESTLADGWNNKKAVINFPSPVLTSEIKIEILDAYEGTKYHDTVISEIEIY